MMVLVAEKKYGHEWQQKRKEKNMAALNGIVEFRSSEYRPCLIGSNKKKALFHRWNHISEIVPPAVLKGGHGGGVVCGSYGIVEFEDGTILHVEPYKIQVLDSSNLFREKAFFFEEAREVETTETS